jgi:hypothetical protein
VTRWAAIRLVGGGRRDGHHGQSMAIELCSALSCSVYTMRGKLRSRVGVNRRPNLTPDRLPLYVSIEFATAARSCACGLRPRGRDPAWSDGLENHVSLEPRLIAFRDHQTSGLTEGVNIAGD